MNNYAAPSQNPPTKQNPARSSREFMKRSGWNEVFRDHGLKWEEAKSVPGKFTIRLLQSYRAVVVRDGGFMRFQTLHQDHDAAYGKK